MINRIFKLVDVKQFDIVQEEIAIPDKKLLVRPTHLTVCAADLRYYMGKRDRRTLMAKLPLALIHEAVGTVLVDPLGQLAPGSGVVLIPNQIGDPRSDIKGNYQRKSRFRSSSQDGFMQDFILTSHDRVVPIGDSDRNVLSFSELLSVSINAISNFEQAAIGKRRRLGVWGDGSLGFATTIALKYMYPEAKIYVFGHNPRKSLHFVLADAVYNVMEDVGGLELDHCFECVGGRNSVHAIEQMIGMLRPQGSISLLGVSEEPVPINTRKVLEKGIMLLGNSRSEREDFLKAVDMIKNDEMVRRYLRTIISEERKVSSLEDIYAAFENAQMNDFKTIMLWNV